MSLLQPKRQAIISHVSGNKAVGCTPLLMTEMRQNFGDRSEVPGRLWLTTNMLHVKLTNKIVFWLYIP